MSPTHNHHLCFSFTDAHSLHYDFSISGNRQAQCKVQGQLDEKDFLSYDCGTNKVTSINHLREEVNATDFWKEQIAKMKDVGDLLKEQLPDIKPERNTDSGKLESPSAGGSGLWAQPHLLYSCEKGK